MTLAVKVNCQHLDLFMVWPPHIASSMQRITHFFHTYIHIHSVVICFRELVERLIWLQISSVSSAAMLQCCNVRISLGVKLAAMRKYDCVSNQLQHENITMCNISCNAKMSLCVKSAATREYHCVSYVLVLVSWCWCWWQQSQQPPLLPSM